MKNRNRTKSARTTRQRLIVTGQPRNIQKELMDSIPADYFTNPKHEQQLQEFLDCLENDLYSFYRDWCRSFKPKKKVMNEDIFDHLMVDHVVSVD